MNIEPGQTIEVPNYPFVRTKWESFDVDGPYVNEGWRPGCDKHEDRDGYFPVYDYTANATGSMLLTVISTHKPGPKHQERVFYIRKWRDPDGNVFGRNRLRVTTKQAFGKLVKGYRHQFDIEE